MNTPNNPNDTRAQLLKALQALQKTRQKLEALEAARHEPIAVIGMACRFPGADSPEAFWELLSQGRDQVGPVPAGRWDADACYHPVPGTPGATYVREGAFLDAPLDEMDAPFFGIAPREAMYMDPQQRLLLEVAWEALERAGQAPAALRNSRTGVFVGVSPSDYPSLLDEAGRSEVYATTGNSPIFAAGRLSYVLGLQGPSLVIDTACSASLIGVHLACESLRNRGSDLALAGGSHLMLTPQGHVVQSQLQALAPDGRCKTFDAAANGYGRGEGCGVVVLKRLSDAQADGDPILALIRGSATNHDGPSSGLTVPSATAQAALIRQALADGGVAPQDVSYVEAHGTGTKLGDPIEVRALATVFGERPADQPLTLGALKANIGHLEEAAGVAGLIKVVLALQHGALPPQLHFAHPNPHIDWLDGRLRVATALSPWTAQRKVAGVSSFGLGGANAHVVVEQAPAPAAAPADAATAAPRPWHLLALSARSQPALRALARRHAEWLRARPDADLGDLCATAFTGRSHFSHRLALAADTPAALLEQLQACADDPGAWAGTGHGVASAQGAPKVAFLFTGQGSQYPGMGRALFEREPVFRAVIERCDAVMRAEMGRSLVALLHPATEADHRDLVASHPCGQAANFALECGLAELWRAWGVQPAFVLGHSLGDYAAACTAGVLGLEDGLRLVIERGRLMERASGRMLSAIASEAQALGFIAGLEDVSLAAVNGPQSVVVSGGAGSVARVAAAMQAAGLTVKELAIPVAAHSPLLDPVLDAYAAALSRVSFSPARIPVVSGMTGQRVTHELADPAYWRRHLRQTVRFADGVATLHGLGCRAFLEIGPQATLLGMAGQVLDALPGAAEAAGPAPLLVPSLRQGQDDGQQMLLGLGALYTRGLMPDWSGLDPQRPRRKLVLPTYPFQRGRHWVDRPAAPAPLPAPAGAATPLVECLQRGEGPRLLELLGQPAGLSAAARAALPELVELLLSRQRQQAEAASLDGLLYQPAWRDQGAWGSAAQGLPPIEQVAATLSAQARQELARPELRQALEAHAKLEAGCIGYVLHLFDQAGQPLREDQRWTTAAAAQALGVVPAHRPLFGRLLEMLAEAGVLERQGADWRVLCTPAPVDLDARLQNLRQQAGAAAGTELTLLSRCGPRLLAMLRGQETPLEQLFLDDTAARLYRDTAPARMMNGLVASALAAALGALPAGQGVRILEIGAGTGGTTAGLLATLPAGRTRYTFTDQGAAFLKQARERFAGFGFVDFRPLDIELPPAAQGFMPGQYDVVLAANVLHATTDLRTTLAHVRSLLAPGGLLVLLEATAKRRWIDLTFGLTEGWWRAADERQGHPLLPTHAWLKLLAECGFEAAAATPEADAADGELGQALLLARASSAPAGLPAGGRRWLLLADAVGLAEALAAQLRRQGDEALLVHAGEAWSDSGGPFVVNPADPQDFRRLLAACPGLHGVVHLWGLDATADGDAGAAAHPGCAGALHLVQALAERPGPLPRLWLVTQDAQAATPGDAVRGAAQAPLWGLGRGIALEHPELGCTCIDLDGRHPPAAQLQALVAELGTAAGAPPAEDRIALRGGRRHVARLARCVEHRAARPVSLRPDASYLLTGGLGGLGLAVAGWLVEQGARHLVLLGRGAPRPEAQRQLDTLRALGATVQVAQADVGDRAQLAAVLASLDPARPLAGLIHAAAAADTAALLHQADWAHFRAVLRPKLEGAAHLDALTRHLPLDFFVCFSSVTALTGDLGLAAYAAANSFLDALCHQRRAAGRPGLSINWGIWSEVGAAVRMDDRRSWQLQDQGHGRLSPSQGLAALGRLLGLAEPQVAVMPMDWDAHRRAAAPTPLFAELCATAPVAAQAVSEADAAAPAEAAPGGSDEGASPHVQLGRCAAAERPAFLARQVAGLAARVLRLPRGESLAAEESLLALGLDSLMAVELRNHLRRTWGVDVPFARFLQGASVRDVAAELLRRLDLPPDPAAPGAAAQAPSPSSASVPSAPAADAGDAGHHEDQEWITGTI